MNAPAEHLREIYTQAGSEDVDVRALGTALGHIQGLAETVLRYTQLFYGRVGANLTDPKRAAVILGPKVVGHIAVQHQLVCGLDEAALPEGVSGRLWSDWIHRALAARFLAARTKAIHPDLAFTAGLALEWGAGPMLAKNGQHLRWLAQVRTNTGPRRQEAEYALFSETSADVFERFAADWGLPAWLSAIVRLHRLPVDPVTTPQTAALQRMCAWATQVGEAITSPAAGPHLEECVRSATSVGVHPQDAWQIIEQVLKWTPRTAEVIDVQIAKQPTLDDLRARQGDYRSMQGGADWAMIVQAENDRLREQVSELQASLARAERQDPITRLPAHHTFLELSDTALDEVRTQGDGATMILIDLDDFVDLNGRHGHRIGNRLLEEVAHRLRGVTRADNVLGRVGPDGFAILVPGDVRTGQVIAERARAAIEALTLDIAGARIQVTATVFGLAHPDVGEGLTAGQLLTAAYKLRRAPTSRSRNRTVWQN